MVLCAAFWAANGIDFQGQIGYAEPVKQGLRGAYQLRVRRRVGGAVDFKAELVEFPVTVRLFFSYR